MDYVPVVDISRYQGTFMFDRAVAHGVQGFIVRATHGRTVDQRLGEYVQGLRDVGVADSHVGFYTFVNPSRCDPTTAAEVFVDAVRAVRGDVDTFLMLDVEDYTSPSNLGPLPILKGDEFVDYLWEMVRTIERVAPGARIVFYSNGAYWNHWVVSSEFADYPIIVPRYINYRASAPKPPVDASLWDEWAFSQPKRPVWPNGWDDWDGWQFSAGFNSMGAALGAQSKDLDLNIVRGDAWSKWTTPVPKRVNPPAVFVEDDDMASLAPELVRFEGYKNVFLFANNTFTHLTDESTARLREAGVPDVVLDAHPQGVKSALVKAGLVWADLVVEG